MNPDDASVLVLCDFDELPDPGSRGFRLERMGEPLELLVVRREDRVFAYQNSCPHTGINLEWQPDRFLDISLSFIQCATHGALFRIDDGLCLRGPCVGQRLTPLKIGLVGGKVVLMDEPARPPGYQPFA
ncbi:MAG: Rieske 2Fe-2S domain-containing protein [Candidatus Thiodiazotropha sp.]